jgi:hypothetical protein
VVATAWLPLSRHGRGVHQIFFLPPWGVPPPHPVGTDSASKVKPDKHTATDVCTTALPDTAALPSARPSGTRQRNVLGKGGPSAKFSFAEGWALGKFWPSAKVAGVTAATCH